MWGSFVFRRHSSWLLAKKTTGIKKISDITWKYIDLVTMLCLFSSICIKIILKRFHRFFTQSLPLFGIKSRFSVAVLVGGHYRLGCFLNRCLMIHDQWGACGDLWCFFIDLFAVFLFNHFIIPKLPKVSSVIPVICALWNVCLLKFFKSRNSPL